MEDQLQNTIKSDPRVKATFRLGSEVFSVNPEAGVLSEQLIALKARSMSILKEYITKHNVPNDVPDEPIDGSSDDETEELDNPPKKSKKQK